MAELDSEAQHRYDKYGFPLSRRIGGNSSSLKFFSEIDECQVGKDFDHSD
jgi:hypothetical protein